ncbi:MAG: flagellar hook-length control protein FliK [Cyanobacteria bacterium DS3.002]|nr:flagellar hook-length control protein FliK [Cyanobacteria bacterium DS3.002]
MSKITINNVTIDPALQGTQLHTMGLMSETSASSNYIIIQTDGPLTKDKKKALAEHNVEILEYVPENAYICRFEPSNLSTVRGLPFVTWANTYMQGFKVPKSLSSRQGEHGFANMLELGSPETSMSQEPEEIAVILHRDQKLDQPLLKEIAQAARMDQHALEEKLARASDHKVMLKVRPQDLERIAQIDEVRHLEKVVPPKLFGEVALEILKANNVHSNGSQLQGEGQIVAVCDTGFDKGNSNDPHPAFAGRVLKLYALGRAGSASDPNGHGTHVAGSVLGDGQHHAGEKVRGTAPKAELILQSVLDASGGLDGLPDDLNDLFSPAYQDNARIHTNSWGSAVYGVYTDNSRETDSFIWEHRDFVICFAAGNEGADKNANGEVDKQSVGSPGTAKNCITVGATESLRPAQSKKYGVWRQDFPVEPFASDLWATNPEGMAAFSSRGPTKDSRIKPDVVAPGTSILSARSRIAQVGDFWGDSQDPLYCFMGGTSMATPLVAGCTAITRQFFIKEGVIKPSASLIKAMLINGAKDITGQYIPSEADSIPNFDEGFGRVNLEATVGPHPQGTKVSYWNEETELDTGDEKTFSIDLPQPIRAFKATLVWTDYPGEHLQNDLDLIVKANGEERHGNMPSGSSRFDRINNVEQVIWEDLPVGKVDITVSAYNVPVYAQSFSLVIRTVE